MRSMLLGLLVAALAQTVAAQNASTLDDPVGGELRIDNPRFLPPCAGRIAVDQIARTANVLVGFENTPDCWLSPRSAGFSHETLTLTGATARQAFDHLMTFMPTYSWKEMDGVAVFRPKPAWADPTDVLNLPTASFGATATPLNDALHTVLHAVTPSVFYPHEDVERSGRPIDAPVSVAFPGGTMLEALNAIVRAHQGAEWQLGYSADRATIALESLAPTGGGVMAPVALPQTRR